MKLRNTSTFRFFKKRLRVLAGGRAIVQIALCVTDKCNARCIMCNTWKTKGQEEFSLDELRRVLEESPLPFIDNFSLTGGEPFLRDDLVEIAALIQSHFPDIRLFIPSNCLDTERVSRMAKRIAGMCPTTVCVSMDGLGGLHDRIRGSEGAFESVVRTVEQLKGHVNLNWSFTIMNENYDSIERVFEFSRKYVEANPLPFINFCCRPVSSGAYFKTAGASTFEKEKCEKIIGQLDRIIGKYPQPWLECVKGFFEKGGRSVRCHAGRTSLVITPGLDVYPCTHCPREWRYGNLRDCGYSLGRLLKGEKARNIDRLAARCRRCVNEIEMPATMWFYEPGLLKSIKLDFLGLVQKLRTICAR